MSDVNPCKVVVEESAPPFDIEEYRADLQRRADTLNRLVEYYGSTGDTAAYSRTLGKARGIEIALSLLP